MNDLSLPPRPLPPFHQDVLNPILFKEVTPYVTEQEQDKLMTDVLNLASSDSRFAQKALAAIKLILAGGSLNPPIPVITSLQPNTGVAGSGPQPLKIRVLGSGFDTQCEIFIDGNVVNTTFVSATEVFTNQSMTSAVVGVKQVVVRNSISGVLSNSMPFTVT